jgi:hypothetical protein
VYIFYTITLKPLSVHKRGLETHTKTHHAKQWKRKLNLCTNQKADNSTKEIISLSLVKGDVAELPLTPPPHKEKRKCMMETLFRFSSHSKCQCTPL